MKTTLIAGLGNPGKKYEKTRHNTGFMFVDYFWKNFREEFGPPTNFIDERVNFSDWEFSKKINGNTSIGKSDGNKIILFKPQTFMNLSGNAVSAAKKYHKVKLENIFVVHDEIDLPLGSFRISKNASSAGHQGIQNIINLLGTKDFTRLRIGVNNRKEKKIATEKYVLGRFANTEFKSLRKILGEAANELLRKIIK